MIPQPIIDIAEICSRKNIKNAVVSPGSRSAPLLISFVRNKKLKTWIFPDERVAGYVACGMSSFEKQPTVLICTSGTAAYNLAPAVAEAFYQQIPLIVLTADRPPEWIGQYDNQTISQNGLFGNHVKRSYTLPVTYDHPDDVWFCNRIISEAINISTYGRMGPVHVNVPLREPLYPLSNQKIIPSEDIRIIDIVESEGHIEPNELEIIKLEWNSCEKKLAVSGQYDCSPEMLSIAEHLFENKIPLISDITANLQQSTFSIQKHDLFLTDNNPNIKFLHPDLLITWGKTILSKNLKKFLRKYKPKFHWHIQKDPIAADTFQSVTRVINMDPISFYKSMDILVGSKKYFEIWHNEEQIARSIYKKFVTQADFGELTALNHLLENLPDGADLHLANSMSVRYANLIGLNGKLKTRVFSNRGVSGIDGCSSFAVGTLLLSNRLTVLVTGDLAFFYDRNAFWHNYPINKLRIILLNNHGGVIFRMIDGPNSQPELEEYFETRQRLNAKNTAKDFGFEHYKVVDEKELINVSKNFYIDDGNPKILEIETNTLISKQIFDQLKSIIKKEYES